MSFHLDVVTLKFREWEIIPNAASQVGMLSSVQQELLGLKDKMSVEYFGIFLCMKEHKGKIELLLEDNEEKILTLAQNKASRLCLEGIFGYLAH